MNQQLTQQEIEKIQQLCFSNPGKACAIAQVIIDTCQIVSCATFAGAKKKSKRTINYIAPRLKGLVIENRKYVSINE